MANIHTAVNEAIAIAKNNKHGYSQKNRNGKPDYDCSSLIIHCLDVAGFPMSYYGATYTGNMRKALIKCGFKNVRSEINIKTGAGLKAGDILLNERYHTAIMVSSTMVVAAHDNYDGKTGDSSGKEIDIYKYRNYSKGWEYVFRYEKNIKTDDANIYNVASDCILGKYGNGIDRIKNLRAQGYDTEKVQTAVNRIIRYFTVAKDVIDGKYGNGETRTTLLRKKGYHPEDVQKIVNNILAGNIPNNLL